MNKLNGKILFALGLVLLLAFLIYVSMGYNPAARLVPLVVLIPGLIGAVIQLGLEVRDAYFKKTEAKTEEVDGTGAKLSPQEKLRREWVAVGWLLLCFAMIMLLGQLIAIPLFVFIFTRFFGRESWRLSIVFAFVCWFFVYALFVWFLHNELYPGILPPLITG